MLLCRRHERGPRVSADLALKSGVVRGRATAALPQNLPTGDGVAAQGVTLRAVRDDVHGPPWGPEATYWPRIQKSIAAALPAPRSALVAARAGAPPWSACRSDQLRRFVNARRYGTEPSSSSHHCPARGHRVNGGSAGRRVAIGYADPLTRWSLPRVRRLRRRRGQTRQTLYNAPRVPARPLCATIKV